MKVRLLNREHCDAERAIPAHADVLTHDLGLTALFRSMARGDDYLLAVARRTVLSGVMDPAVIVYRQQILADCAARPALARQLYALAVDAIERDRMIYKPPFAKHPDAVLRRALRAMASLLGCLRELRSIAEANADTVASEGLTNFFAAARTELNDEYLGTIEHHLGTFAFDNGTLVSATLGDGNKGTDFTLRRREEQRPGLLARLRGDSAPSVTITIPSHDAEAVHALAALRGRGTNPVANAMAQSAEHLLSFFTTLRQELGFYVGCLNLSEDLARAGRPACLPDPLPVGTGALSAEGLYDVGLALGSAGPVTGNRLAADGRSLLLITGANQGGKSTFLRSLGLGQLMMQAGMFVAANAFRAEVTSGIFTHYKREEDTSLRSGKLDEELRRMSAIADHLDPGAMLLCNESFAATNEREGSEIARQVTNAMIDCGVRVVFVTHLYELARGYYDSGDLRVLHLRAERDDDGRRSFVLRAGEPLPTSFGPDLYRRVFGTL